MTVPGFVLTMHGVSGVCHQLTERPEHILLFVKVHKQDRRNLGKRRDGNSITRKSEEALDKHFFTAVINGTESLEK
jgi:hypothetical protein